MGIMDRLKKILGIGQPFDPKDYIDPKWLNPPEVVHPSYEIEDGTDRDASNEETPKGTEVTHWWRHCAERELPNADYYIENYLPGDPTAPDYVSEICIPVKSN